MSDVVTPNETATPAPSAPAAPASRLDRAMSFIASRGDGPAITGPGPAAEPAPAAVEPPVETAPEPEPAPEKPETKDDRDLKIAKAQQASIKQQREAFEAKQRAKAEAEQRAKLEQELAALKSTVGNKDPKFVADLLSALENKDPKAVYKFVKQHGLSMEDLAKAVIEEPDPEPEDPLKLEVKTLKQQIEAIEKAKREAEERAEQERQSREAEKIFEQNVSYVSDLLKQEVEKYPALSSFPRAPAEIVRRFNAHVEEHGEPPNLDDIIGAFERSVFTDVDAILAGEASFKAFLTRPEVKERALSILGVKPSATSPASTQGENGKSTKAPAAIPPTAAADAGSRKSPRLQSQDEKIAAAMALLKQKSAR